MLSGPLWPPSTERWFFKTEDFTKGAFLVKNALKLKLCAADKQVSYCWSWNSGGLITGSANLAEEKEEMKLAIWWFFILFSMFAEPLVSGDSWELMKEVFVCKILGIFNMNQWFYTLFCVCKIIENFLSVITI